MYFIAGAVFLGLGLLSENIFMRILFFAISVYYFLKLYKRHKEKKSAGSTRRVKNPSADVEKLPNRSAMEQTKIVRGFVQRFGISRR